MVLHRPHKKKPSGADPSWMGRVVAGCCFLGLLAAGSLRGDLSALQDSAQQLSQTVTQDFNVLVGSSNSGTHPLIDEGDDVGDEGDRPKEDETKRIQSLQEENSDLKGQIKSLEELLQETKTGEAKAPLHNSIHPPLNNRTVSFLQDGIHFQRDEYADAYSGMWWTNVETVLKLQEDQMTNLEGASFHAFDTARQVLLTRDWLDFGVDHLSSFFKHFDVDQGPYGHAPDDYSYQRLIQLFGSYFERVQEVPREEGSVASEVSRATIALLPFADTELNQTVHSLLADIQKHTDRPLFTLPGDQRRENVLRVQALAMTIASLWQIGIGRVVVVGRRKRPTEMIKAAFAIFKEWLDSNNHQQQPSMELVYVWGLQETTQDDDVHLPVIALSLFQQIFRSSRGETTSMSTFKIQKWLGPDATRWKYVYFSEPDLILNTRPHALEAIARQIQQGNLMAAHRFQLIPHAVDFPEYPWPGRLVPNRDALALVHDLDPRAAGDACCDAGNRHPGLDDYDPCWLWHDCGTRQQDDAYWNVTEMRTAHQRLLGYPLVRLTTGLQIPWVQEHARLCIPKRNGVCVVQERKRGIVN